MAKKKATKKASDDAQKRSRSPKAKKTSKSTQKKKKTSQRRTASSKKKPAKKKSTKKPTKSRRQRSRGKKRNKKTAADHAVNEVESTANGTEQPSNPHVEPPEDFRPGPAVGILDDSDSVNSDIMLIRKMMGHSEWQIPEIAFEALPNKLTRIAMNIGDKRDDQGDVIQKNVPEAGLWSTNAQLTAIRMLKEFHEANLKKLTALKPNEVRVLNEQPTVVTSEDQRLAVVAAIAAELQRRQSGGAIPNQQAGNSIGSATAGNKGTDQPVDDQDEA